MFKNYTPTVDASDVGAPITRRAGPEPRLRQAIKYDQQTARLLDQYYTDPVLAAACMETVKLYFDISQMVLVEPSAGDGSFLGVMPADTIAVDIAPRAPSIIEADFLEFTIESDRKIGFVGNPPYGC